jgi:protein-S-isoprenylcysteine O-methyltransferase Ste14
MTAESDTSRKIRHLRDSLRQTLGILMIILLAVVARPTHPWFWVGACLAVLGILVRLWASGYVKKNEELATRGPYAWVRHPLYVGNLLLAAGFALAAHRWWAYILVGAFLLFFYPNAIREEDAKLRRLFGPVWKEWRSATWALVPSLRPYRKGSLGHWSFTYSLRLNGEPWIALFLAACLFLIYLRL